MNSNLDLNKTDAQELTGENVLTSEIISNLFLMLKNIPKFNDSFIFSKPYNFNFQTTIDGAHKSDYGTILSFFKTSDGVYAVLNNKFDENINILLNLLIEKTHLNIIGTIEQFYTTNLKNIYVAEIIFKNISTDDKNKILHIINGEKDIDAFAEKRAEKREYLRLKKNIPATYQVYTSVNVLSEHAALVYTIDISQGGVKIAASEEVYADNMLYMQIPFKNKTIYCAGKVMWASYSKEINKYLAGIKFIDLSQQTKDDLLELVLS